MGGQILQAILAILLGIGACLGYFYVSNWLCDRIWPVDGGPRAQANNRMQNRVRPWIFLGPALLLLTVYLVYPVLQTSWLTFFDATGNNFAGLKNWAWALGDPELHQAIGNNLQWILIVPALCTALGLLVASLADRVWWGTIAKAMIFMPMAISFVGASVIWKFVYDFRGPDAEQIGSLNALVASLGFEPQAWITLPIWNNFLLMAIMVWLQTGFAMVIFSAALRAVPVDTLEAARIDGAGPLQSFFYIVVPQIMTTIVVVWTTLTIIVLKVFDVVLAMTNGQWNTEVLANLMYDWMFRGGGDFGRGSLVALLIMVAVIPIMAFNITRLRAEKAGA